MKTTIITLALLGLSSMTASAIVPPYSSNFYEEATTLLDEGWTTKNNSNRKAQVWKYDHDKNFTSIGKTGGACKPWDDTYAADCWLISPAITLEAGTTYTMTVYAKTRGSVESESFEVKLGTDATTATLAAGTELYREVSLQSPDAYKEITKEFTVTEAGDYYFGFHCFSEANEYDLYITGFSVTAGTGGGGGEPDPDPITPDPSEAATIPWEQTFPTEPTGWTYVNGPNTTSSTTWAYDSFTSSIKMDATQDVKEDHWAISPALNFEEAGTYALEIGGSLYGKLNFHIGSDASDITTFTRIPGEYTGTNYDYTCKFIFKVETPGIYHIGIQACADAGTYMGYRIKKVAVNTQLRLPVNINDLTVTVSEDPAEARLHATYPAVYNNGDELDAIAKAEILRNGEVIETIQNPTPGSELSYVDTPEPAKYTYCVKIYGTGNTEPEDAPMEVKSDYIGKPYIDMPTAGAVFGTMTQDERDKWITSGWQYTSDNTFMSSAESDGTVDRWFASPYIHIEPGNYRLTINCKAYDNGYTVGLTEQRYTLPENFIQVYECAKEEGYYMSDKVIEFSVENAGDYAIALHHNVSNSMSYSNYIEITSIKLAPIVELPKAVTGLTGHTNEECTEAVLEWVNPSTTNTGAEITEAITITVKRDNELLTTLTGEAGKAMQYTDQTVPDHAKHEYSVITSNANGEQEDEIPSITLDFTVPVTFPYTADFNEWNVGESYNWWEVSEDGYLTFREATTGYSDYAVSPLMEFKADEKYEVTAVFENSTAPVNMRFGTDENGGNHTVIYTFPAPASTSEESMTVTLTCTTAATPEPATDNAAAEGEGGDVTPATTVQIAPAKGYMSMHMADAGKVCMKSLSIVKLNSEGSGVETIFASSEGINYADGIATLPAGVLSYSVTDLQGRTLVSGTTAETIDLREYTGTLIIAARTAESSAILKVMR